MDTHSTRITRHRRAIKSIAIALLLGAGLGGCAVYAPPYAGYDAYPYSSGYAGYGYPAYVAPPVSLSLDFGFYDHGYRGGHYGGWGRGHGRGRH